MKLPSDPIDCVAQAGELFNIRDFAKRHEKLMPVNRVLHAARNRETNGLIEAGAIYKSAVGELIIHEPSMLQWFLGLRGRAKPRRVRKQRAAR